MRKNWLKKIIPLTLSAGIMVGVPAFTQPVLPVGIASVAEAAAPVQWNVGKELDGWKFGGVWAYSGEPEVAADSAFGGSIRVGTDFTNNVNDGWSEVKLENAGAAAQQLDLAGYNTFSFNLYYKPENMTQGSFKLKLYVKSVDDQEVINLCPDIDLSKGKGAGNGMKCVPVQVTFKPVEAKTAYFCLSLVGCNTDYKGDLYVGQLKLSAEKLPDGYVDIKRSAKKQEKVQLGQLAVPAEAALTDAKATPETAKLFAYLKGIAQSDKVLYGHQNELHKKVAKNLPGASDTEDMVGDHAAVMGLDSLALTGNELALTDDEKARGVTLSEKLAGIYIPAANPLLVDDFDGYYGDNGLLGGTYNANTGSGCTVVPQLSQEKNGGDSGLAFRYSINKGGYAGIVKSLKKADWSSCDAIQLWVKPDGKGQKLIIQLNSNGEDFEVDLSKLAATMEAQVITLPFADFKGKNGGTFDASAVNHFGIYCNTIGNETVDSVMYFDSIKAVKQ